MKRVTGIGAIFFKADNTEKLYQWYEKHLGITRAPDGSGAMFEWRDGQDVAQKSKTTWSIFPGDTKKFGYNNSDFIFNYHVDVSALFFKKLLAKRMDVDCQSQDF